MKRYMLGIDVGGTNVKIGLVGPSYKIVDRERISTKQYNQTRQKLIRTILKKINAICERNQLKKRQIAGIGFGLPGLIDPVQGKIHFLPNIAGWKNVPLAKIIRSHTGLKTFLGNDVQLITLAEWKLGAGKGFKNIFCITLGTGVGGAMILDGRLYRGEGFVAGEVGHFPYDRSTLEKHVGNSPLLKRAAGIFKQERLTLEDVFQKAKQGNAKAVKFWEQAGVDIGTVMAGVVNVLNPRLLIIGGGVSNNLKYIKPGIDKAIKAHTMGVQRKMVKIVRAKLGDDAGILGAAILVQESIHGK